MKNKKKLLGVALSLAILLFSSAAIASSFTVSFASRGTNTHSSNKYVIDGKICRLAGNVLIIDVDRNTPYRNVKYTMDYLTQGVLGIYTVSDSAVFFNTSYGNTGDTDSSINYLIPQTAFVEADYNSGEKAFFRVKAEGASSAYYFRINNAVFTFSNN